MDILLVLLFSCDNTTVLGTDFENTNLPRTRWTAPALMKLSMWTHALGRFAMMQIIACVNWTGFSCWLVWVRLYYQMYSTSI